MTRRNSDPSLITNAIITPVLPFPGGFGLPLPPLPSILSLQFPSGVLPVSQMGETGSAGPIGAIGATGPAGPTGPTGPAGSSNWSNIQGRPYITVTPNGPTDGGDYGPNTPGTTTNGFREAIIAAAGKYKIVITGSYTITAQTNLSSGTYIEFDNATLTLGANVNMFGTTAATDLSFVGTVTFNGGSGSGFVGDGFLLNGCTNVLFDWNCQVSKFSASPARYLILSNPTGATLGSGIMLRGQTTTTDSTVIRVNDCNNVDVSGVQTIPGGLTASPGVSIISVVTDNATASPRGLNIHDCQIDGGGVMNISGLINIHSNVNAPIYHVTIKNCMLRNTETIPGSSLYDGLDIANCIDVAVNNIVVDSVFDGVSFTGQKASISNVVAENCNGNGVAIGDSTVQAMTTSDVVVSDCVAQNCGQNGTSGGFACNSTSGQITDRISFANCRTRDTTGSSQPYGFLVLTNGTTTNVQWTGGEINGYKQPIYNPQSLTLTVRGAKGINDIGVIGSISGPFNTTNATLGIPTIGASGVASPTLGKNYVVTPSPLHLEVSSALGIVSWQDAQLNYIVSGVVVSALRPFEPDPGHIITFGASVPTYITVTTVK